MRHDNQSAGARAREVALHLACVRHEESRCPFCHDDVVAPAGVVCQGCRARHHAGCWAEAGTCASCRGAQLEPGPRVRVVETTSTAARVERALEPGEQLLWTGRPRRGVFFRVEDQWRLPVALAVMVAPVCFVLAVARQAVVPGPPGFPELALLTAWSLHGLYLLVGRFLLDAWRRERLVYCVTNRRVLVFGRSVRSLPLVKLEGVRLLPEGDRVGTIVLGPGELVLGGWPRSWQPRPRLAVSPFANLLPPPPPPCLESVTDPDGVLEIMRRARRDAAAHHGNQTPRAARPLT